MANDPSGGKIKATIARLTWLRASLSSADERIGAAVIGVVSPAIKGSPGGAGAMVSASHSGLTVSSYGGHALGSVRLTVRGRASIHPTPASHVTPLGQGKQVRSIVRVAMMTEPARRATRKVVGNL